VKAIKLRMLLRISVLLLFLLNGCITVSMTPKIDDQPTKELFSWFKSEPKKEIKAKTSLQETKSYFLTYVNWIAGIALMGIIVGFILAYIKFPLSGDVLYLSSVIFAVSFSIALFLDYIVFILGIAFFLCLAYVLYQLVRKFKDQKLKEYLVETVEKTKHLEWSKGGKEVAKSINKPLWAKLEIEQHKEAIKTNSNREKYRDYIKTGKVG